jgi:hypothetical protein
MRRHNSTGRGAFVQAPMSGRDDTMSQGSQYSATLKGTLKKNFDRSPEKIGKGIDFNNVSSTSNLQKGGAHLG